MLKQIALGVVLLAGLLVGSAWGDEALNKALFEAARHGDRAKVEALVSKGADVNAKNEYGSTALHATANREVAQFLIAHGADVNAQNKTGFSPLHDMASSGKEDVAELLIAHGADVNAKDKYGDTPLYSVRSKKVAELLIAHGADLMAKDIYGRTPLHMAHDEGGTETLLANGINVNARDSEGFTPLHHMAAIGRSHMIKFLLAKGADVNAMNNNYSSTPLHAAANSNASESAELLIAAGADISAINKEGHTPLDVAKSKGNTEFITSIEAAVKKRDDNIAMPLRAALAKPSGIQRETFNRVLADYKDRAMSDAIRRPFIELAAKLKPAPAVPEEAIKYEGRAQFAFKNAESPADVLSAAKEYEKAVAAAPWVPGYYSDLCTIYEKAKKYAEAKKNCEFFLASSSSAQEVSDTNKRIAGLEFAIEKTNSPEAQAARQAESQREKDAALKNSLDGAVFVKRATFDYGTAEWEIRINAGEATYTYEVLSFVSDVWRQRMKNSGYDGSKTQICKGLVDGRQITLVNRVAHHGFEKGDSMKCEISSDGFTSTCIGTLIDNETWIFQRK